ncbi:hypothetical protein GGI23_003136 [Coemansia sp. RSA 2559]|nr:hypothetical protein GGI23_003136 [Coemansia sp. RSA 2559]KAJ2848045.1 hypothetical protein GGI22_005819 [Coemansia erecta]
MSVRKLNFSRICVVVFAMFGASAVLGAVVPNTAHTNAEPSAVVVQTIVSDIDTNLSRFVPNMLAEARFAEQAAMALGLISPTGMSAETPSPIVEKEEFWIVDPAA